MATRVFRSKIDGWMIPLVLVAIAGSLVALVAVFAFPAPWPVRALVAVLVVVMTFLLMSVFRNTFYEVGDSELRVVSGPFRWTIPIADITAIVPSRSPLSSPALSLDRLKLSFGKRKSLLVSPEDKEGFQRAIEQARAG